MRAALATAALVATATWIGPASPMGRASDTAAWSTLTALRQALTADSPLAARFSQTFIPAGFSDGDTETGVVSFDLPSCIRWDYSEPFAKTFLVCEQTVYTWNLGETSGRRAPVPPEEALGLDLLRLDTQSLVKAFDAHSTDVDGAVSVDLAPRSGTSVIRRATLELDPGAGRLTSIDFTDTDGNRTIFRLEDYRALDSRGGLGPPDDMAWIDE